jgi:hypothetical protein
VIACAVVAPGVAGAAGPRQTASAVLTTREPGTATGSTQSIHIRNPDDPSAKPYTIKTIVFRLAPGSTLDTGALPQCKASDAELMAQGAAACPASSHVSTGLVQTDTGSPGVLPRFINNDAQNFNNDGEVVGVADAREIPLRTVTRSRIAGNTISFDYPEAPGGPPDNSAALSELTLVSPPLVRGGRAYARTPSTCPASGFWEGSILFIYRDGVRQTVDTKAPCNPSAAQRRLDRTPPRIRLRARKGCARRARRVAVRVHDRSGLRRVAAYVDGRLVRSTRRAAFRVRVRRGRHRLTVLARDGVGNRARRTLRFRVCGAA